MTLQMTMHVVQYSGGIGSWAATQRVIAEHGTANLVLLIADTRVEDPDLWRFVYDSTALIGVEPIIVADGRTPFEVFHDQRFLVLSPRRHLSERETSSPQEEAACRDPVRRAPAAARRISAR